MRPFAAVAYGLACALLAGSAWAGQAPGAASAPDIPVSHADRVYAAEQFSNTVSVTDPASNTLLGVIRVGDPQPGNLSPLYRGQVLVHGMGFSPDHRTLAVVAIGTNAVIFIDTATNTVRHVTYVGRAPHEAFFTPDGKEVWVTVRGENYVEVLDSRTYEEKTRITVPNGPGMTIFSPDDKYGYVCSSFAPETDVITVADHQIVGRVVQASPFCPNIAATPDGTHMWTTPLSQGLLVRRSIACIHMSGLFVRHGRWPRWFPRSGFQTGGRPWTATGSHGLFRLVDRSIRPSPLASSAPTWRV